MLVDFALYSPLFLSLTWAFILFFSSKTNRARLFLGLFMLAVSMIFLSHVIYYHHLKSIYLPFDLIFIFGSLSIFPIYYLYMKILSFQSKIDFKDMRLMLPALGMVALVTVIYLQMNPLQRGVYLNKYLYGKGSWKDATLLIRLQLISGYTLQTIYFVQIVFSFLRIRFFIANYNDNIANYYSNLEDKTMEWPKIILYTFVISSAFTIVTNFLGRSFFDKYPLILLFTGLGYSVFLFILGYLGFLQNHSIKLFEQENEGEVENIQENPDTKKMKLKIQKLFEIDRIYTNKELKISDVAILLNTNRTYLSNFINNEFNCSFSTFVSKYRIEEARNLLLDDNNNNYSLDYIASLAGFGTLHSFIRVFKEVYGTTPGHYRDSSQKNQFDK